MLFHERPDTGVRCHSVLFDLYTVTRRAFPQNCSGAVFYNECNTHMVTTAIEMYSVAKKINLVAPHQMTADVIHALTFCASFLIQAFIHSDL